MPIRQNMRTRKNLIALEKHQDFPAALEIIQTLKSKGFVALLAGGCVRDAWLNKSPADLDIATSATPDEVERTFARTLAVGKAFGTIRVQTGAVDFEVTTFREDGEYLDARHPSSVVFSRPEADAQRRDFTVNALFYDPVTFETIDYVGGLADLQARRLKAVGDPFARFSEDALRTLRALRFVAQLGFELDAGTAKALKEKSASISHVSSERVWQEIKKLLSGKFLLQSLGPMVESNMCAVIWPELIPHAASKLQNQLRGQLPFRGYLHAFVALTFAAGCPVEAAVARLRVWKAANADVHLAKIYFEGCLALADKKTPIEDKIRVLASDTELITLELLRHRCGPEFTEDLIKSYRLVMAPDGQLPKPFLTGQDLIGFGQSPGPAMGAALKHIYNAQLRGEVRSREQALAYYRLNQSVLN